MVATKSMIEKGRVMSPRFLVMCVVSAAIVSACNSGVGQSSGSQPGGPPALAVPPAVSVNAVMVALVDHAGHALWDVEKEGRAPKTDEDWNDLEHHATQIAAAGSLIALGGTGKADPGWALLPDWKKHSQALTDVGLRAVNAAHSKSFDTLVKTNGELVQVCENCHKEFKPELPTEGIVHPHYRK